MRLDLASVLLQWATGGLLGLWVTQRHRMLGVGYGWLLRGVYGAMAIGAIAAGIADADHGAGATLRDAVRIVVYVTDMARLRPVVNAVQEELWGAGPYPPRTIVEVHRLNQDDVVEVEGTFHAPVAR